MTRILAVSNDLSVCRQIHAALEGHSVEVALDAVCARMALPDGFDLMLVDAGLGHEGPELVAHVRRVLGEAIRVAALGDPEDPAAQALMVAGAGERTSKPISAQELRALVSRSVVSVA
jgi:DNA-binding response OmpR family regulator